MVRAVLKSKKMKINLKMCIVLNLLIMVFISCTNRVEENMLPGKYGYNRSNYLDTIEVFQNNKYLHYFISTSGEKKENTGTWKFDLKNQKIVFDDFVFFNEEGESVAGLWISRVKKTNKGEIWLIYSKENRIYYLKSE